MDMATFNVSKYFLAILFLFVKVKSGVRLTISHNKNGAGGIVCEMANKSKKLQTEDMNMQQLLNIHFENEFDDYSEIKVPKGNLDENADDSNEYDDKQFYGERLNNVTIGLQDISNTLDEIKNEMSAVTNRSTSNSCNASEVKGTTQNFNSLVGVDNKPSCQCSRDLNFSTNKLNLPNGHIPRSCADIHDMGGASGVYQIQPKMSDKPFNVLCDMKTKGGGWTHIQKRVDGSQDFYLGWREYKFGFGDLTGEFWLGLEHIHMLTAYEVTELLVEIVDRSQVKAYAHYQAFAVGPEVDGYPLKILSGFSGDAGDSLTYHLGAKFTTKDFDQDGDKENCAELFSGAWWYVSCHFSNLNGKYMNVELPKKYNFHGLHWAAFRGHTYCHAKARMMVRPAHRYR